MLGGLLVTYPTWVAPVPNNLGLTAPNIPKLGLQIPAICENRLTLAYYGATVYHSIGRTIETSSLTRARLREFKKHKEMATITRSQILDMQFLKCLL